jgi:hypothetical protein
MMSHADCLLLLRPPAVFISPLPVMSITDRMYKRLAH